MERKLATVLFVDLVDHTSFVSGVDPEVVRRRVTRFFDRVSGCIATYGGTVEKFAGDAVMAAFGVPISHDDDAERALRAALEIKKTIDDLGLEARLGVEAGEVVADDSDSTFATGEAVNLAARLEQMAEPNEILVGPSARRLADGRFDFEPLGARTLRGRAEPLEVWRVLALRERGRPATTPAAPLVGRDGELDLLENTFERVARGGRAHLFTIYGEPGVGKSRLAREFVGSLDGATVLFGRCLPYGEGITYWPLAEMVKAAAGIADDDTVEEAKEKLREYCEDEEVADLLGLASGFLTAVEEERSAKEIAWGASAWAERLAEAQPLVLVFEDVHWAEEPLLALVEQLAARVRGPLLIVCLARPELLDVHGGWGGGRVRATAIELEPLPREESEALVDALLADEELPLDVRSELLDKTEGNPLFVEETIRMLSEGNGDGPIRIPDTVQALIAARIDRLPTGSKLILQRAAVIGRVFWAGAIMHLSPDVEEVDSEVDDLLARNFVTLEQRSSISGERALRFKHVLIREVAYAGMPKAGRAQHHERFAEWLHERTGEELLEIRAYHLDQAARLTAELEGTVPDDLRCETAAALTEAGKRALAREANRSARALLLRATELEPTLERRHKAAVAAWRLDDLPAVAAEMEGVADDAREVEDGAILGRALSALAHVSLLRDGDLPRAAELAEESLSVLAEDDAAGRSDALFMLAQMAWWRGDLAEHERYVREALELAHAAGLKDVESEAARKLASAALARLRLEEAQEYVVVACRLAEESGSLIARAESTASRGEYRALRGEFEDAEPLLEQARALYEEAGAAWPLARVLNHLADLAARRGDDARSERLLRDAIRILRPLEDRGALCESQRALAELLVKLGRIDEAERVALEARKTVGPHDQVSRATTRLALARVRAAQGRDEEAESLVGEALEILDTTDFANVRVHALRTAADWLRERGRPDEADALVRRAAELGPVAASQVLLDEVESAARIA